MSELPKLSRTEHLILGLIVNSDRPLFGMEMVNASEGSLKRGAIYVTLQRMETKGLLESKQEKRNPPEIGIPRRLYSTTERGLRACLAYDVAQAVMTSEDGKPLDRDTIDELIQQALFDRGLPKDSGGKGLSPNP